MLHFLLIRPADGLWFNVRSAVKREPIMVLTD